MKKIIINIIAIALIFICGTVAGAGGTLIFERHIIKKAIDNPQRARAIAVNRMAKRYDLTPEQQKAIQQILTEQAKKFAEIRMSVAPDVENAFKEARMKMLQELDESQQEQFENQFTKALNAFRKAYYADTRNINTEDQ